MCFFLFLLRVEEYDKFGEDKFRESANTTKVNPNKSLAKINIVKVASMQLSYILGIFLSLT